jgi:hypothetical protein
MKVFTVQNCIDIRKNDIFKRYYDKHFHKYSIAVHVLTATPSVNLPKRVLNNGSAYQDVYKDGWEIEMLTIIGKSLNMSLDIESDNEEALHLYTLLLLIYRNANLWAHGCSKDPGSSRFIHN